MTEPVVQPFTEQDTEWKTRFFHEHWGGTLMISRGVTHHLDTHPGFIALLEGNRAGLLTYYIQNQECEITCLESLKEGRGIGTALIEAAKAAARDADCTRLWLITSNDNVDALRFYQKRGFTLVAVHRDAITEARKLKPQIPLTGNYGIPIRDEIELECPLSGAR
uniref:N-acetyltransferase n=1 Tax=Thermosporothrix sp. COM3 TaxID=2490863 RepID=A0A455SSQ4_9CHLR|nr:N-acetyltransferase [Thermosporothrix sp. COM3]